jgi:hypothetical protein
MKTFAFILLSLIAASDIAAAQSAVTSKTEQEARLLALADVDFGDVYSADGAGDGTLTYQGEILKSTGANLKPDTRVKAIVDLRASVVPLLIAHLDDTRPTRTMFEGKPTPLGHMALDILTHVIKQTDVVFVRDCSRDGLGACIHTGYYFRPDATVADMENAKDKWRRLYANGRVVFQYPKWWR